jgi:hypothetical protein
LTSPNRGGPDAALRPSTQILNQITPFNLRSNLYKDRVRSDVEASALSRVAFKRLRSITERDSFGAPLCTIALLFISTRIFLWAFHHDSESGTEFKKKNEAKAPWLVDRLRPTTRGVALWCVEGGWSASELETRKRLAAGAPFFKTPCSSLNSEPFHPAYRRCLSWTQIIAHLSSEVSIETRARYLPVSGLRNVHIRGNLLYSVRSTSHSLCTYSAGSAKPDWLIWK